MTFKKIETIDDVRPFVAQKKEIRFHVQPNGTTIGCYMFMDSSTFDTPEALECRGVVFDPAGRIVSRPLHKFFNAGEKPGLDLASLRQRRLAGIYEKIDGSMIATALVDGRLAFRSKKSFASDVVRLAGGLLDAPGWEGARSFADRCARAGLTAIFELTHPEARIVVAPGDRGRLTLLHVRENLSGEYVLLDPGHEVHSWIGELGVPVVQKLPLSFDEAIDSLADMRDKEGYVFQFEDGDMVKVKCPWYLRLHRSVTFLRERDIALLSINEELDDLKGALREAGIDLGGVEEVEARLKGILSSLEDDVEGLVGSGTGMERKEFALTFKDHPLFGLAMARRLGKETEIGQWYAKNRLKDEFGLRVLAGEALAEALEG